MHLFDECMYAPTSASNKNKLAPKGKLVKPNLNKSNFDFLLLFSNAPTRPRPCQSITLIYFHHPPTILKLLPFSLLVVLKTTGCSDLLQDTKIHRAEICFCHNLKTMHPFAKMFHGKMHMDDRNMLKQFQQIPMHSFREIGLHHLQPFFHFCNICASI